MIVWQNWIYKTGEFAGKAEKALFASDSEKLRSQICEDLSEDFYIYFGF